VARALRELGPHRPIRSGGELPLFEQTQRPPGNLHAALFRRGVLIRNVSSAPGLPTRWRVSIGAPAANDSFLAAIRAELAP